MAEDLRCLPSLRFPRPRQQEGAPLRPWRRLACAAAPAADRVGVRPRVPRRPPPRRARTLGAAAGFEPARAAENPRKPGRRLRVSRASGGCRTCRAALRARLGEGAAPGVPGTKAECLLWG